MKWEDACKSKMEGVLGIGHLKERNLALLGKWLWCFTLEMEHLWYSTILNKYGMHSNGWDYSSNLTSSMSLIC